MADKVSDAQADELLAKLRLGPDGPSIDARIALVNAVKSSIKHHNVPEECLESLFEALRIASSSQHSPLAHAGFSALNHLLTRMSLQQPKQHPKLVAQEVQGALPLVLDKLGDHKERMRTLAIQALTTIHAEKTAADMVDRSVRNLVMAGKNPRAKESSLIWLEQMHEKVHLQFRPFVPSLMDLLEDADPTVRDVAKTTVINLFRNASNPAKSDLKRQLKNFKVRPAIEAAIVKELIPASAQSEATTTTTSIPTALPAMDSFTANAASAATERPIAPPRPATTFAASMSALSSATTTDQPITHMLPESRLDAVEPSYVNTHRELDDIFREMHVHFEGRETEQNWLKREESITKLRRLIAGNAPSDFLDPFVQGLRSLLDGIIKGVVSLRTSLSKEASSLVQNMAISLGPAMDPMVELLMQTFVKLTAATKKIASQMANVTVDTILSRVTYNNRIMQHVWGACQDKNVQPRAYAAGWLKTLLTKEATHKSHIEHTGGLDLIEKCLKKGINDANPGVREKMRSTYWLFAAMWADRAELIMSELDPQAQKLLNKDPGNPNRPEEVGAGVARPGLGLSRSTMSASTSTKPSLREVMLSQKKAAAAKSTTTTSTAAAASTTAPASSSRHLPSRPQSAMSRTTTEMAPPLTTSASTTTSVATKPESGMRVAPMRPGRRNMPARPATAGPYSVRSHDHMSSSTTGDAASSSVGSPIDHHNHYHNQQQRPRTGTVGTTTPKHAEASPRRTAPKGRPGHASQGSESSLASPTRASLARKTATAASTAAAHKASPARFKRPQSAVPPASPTRMHHEEEEVQQQQQRPQEIVVQPLPEPVSEPEPVPEPEAKKEPEPVPEPEPEQVMEPEQMPKEPAAVQSSQPEQPESPPEPVQEPTEATHEMQDVQPELSEPISTPPNDAPANIAPESSSPAKNNLPQTTTTTGGVPDTLDGTPIKIKVFEDPFTTQPEQTPKGAPPPTVLGDRPVNEDAVSLTPLPDKSRQNARLLDSGISRIRSKTLDVHGFRKLQSLMRDNKGTGVSLQDDNKFSALVQGLFEYLQDPLPALAPEKALDVKAQVLATLRILLARERDSFQPHVSLGLEALLAARSAHNSRAHIVSGLELLADELVALGDPAEMMVTITRWLQQHAQVPSGGGDDESSLTSSATARSQRHGVGMGLHVLGAMLNARGAGFALSAAESGQLAALAGRCLESADSGMRMDAVGLCVALHGQVGEGRFWEAMGGVGEDARGLITYYVVKRQRETEGVV